MPNQAFNFQHQAPFELENGDILPELNVRYHRYGPPPASGTKVVWVCHALTASSDVFDWWPGLFGPGNLFHPGDYTIICANVIGSPYGSTAPLTEKTPGDEPWYHAFPRISIRDMVKAHELLREYLGIARIHLAIGGSMGGQQVLEWAIQQPEIFENIAVLATNAVHSAWGRAFNESQRMAIAADSSWLQNHPEAGRQGLATARSIAMLSYRHYKTYEATQQDAPDSLGNYRAPSYQRYQGEKLAKRFNAFSYWRLSEAMDSHDVGRKRGGAKAALGKIKAHTLVIGVDTDVLFPITEQEFFARHIPGAQFVTISSLYGHDGFLIETTMISHHLTDFLTCKKN
jgi:homoserine O-acetyltransferase/O-succinyltransferase